MAIAARVDAIALDLATMAGIAGAFDGGRHGGLIGMGAVTSPSRRRVTMSVQGTRTDYRCLGTSSGRAVSVAAALGGTGGPF